MNSLDVATKEALLAAVRQVADDAAVRCVVLTGTGRAFCVGPGPQGAHRDPAQRVDATRCSAPSTSTTTRSSTTLVGMAKPVIAAVNGVAAGAGASLAFACDLRIVADTAGFNLAFANIALSCDTGSSFTLQRLVGRAKAIELLYFPRTVKADEALALGLATRVVPAGELAEAVADLAARLAAGPTVALGAMRQSRARSPPATPSTEARGVRVGPDDAAPAPPPTTPPPSRRSWPRRSRSSRGARGLSGSRSPGSRHCRPLQPLRSAGSARRVGRRAR